MAACARLGWRMGTGALAGQVRVDQGGGVGCELDGCDRHGECGIRIGRSRGRRRRTKVEQQAGRDLRQIERELDQGAQAGGIRENKTLEARIDLQLRRGWIDQAGAGARKMCIRDSFHLVTPLPTTPEEKDAIVQALRKVTNAAVGQRIVISDFEPNWSDYDPRTQRWICLLYTSRCV